MSEDAGQQGDSGSAWGETQPAWGETASAWGDTPQETGDAALPTQEFPTLGDVKAVSQPTRKGNRAASAFDSRGGSRGGRDGGGSREGRHNLPRGPGSRGGGGGYRDDRGDGGRYERDDRRGGRGDRDGGRGDRDGGRGGHNRDDYGPRGGSHNRDDYGGRGRDDYGGRSGGYNREEFGRGRPYEVREKRPVPDAPPYTAFVGNIPYDLPPADLCEWLGEESAIEEVRMKRDKAYVDFSDRESLVAALDKDGLQLGGRSIRMDVAEPPRNAGDGKVRDFGMLRNREMPTRSASPPRGGFGSDRRDRGDRGDRGRDGFGGDRGDRRGGGGRDFGARRAPSGPRPKKEFAVKSLLDTGGEAPRPSSIFGDAAPRDESAAQEKLAKEREALKKKREEEREAKKAAAAAKPAADAKPAKSKDWGAIRSADRKPDAKKPEAKKKPQQHQQQKSKPAPKTNAWAK